jgi:hypothetical protein
MEISRRIRQLHLGTQHKHRQTFHSLGDQIAPAHQQHFIEAGLAKHKARLHTSFGVAKSAQMALVCLHQQDVLGELVMEKIGSVFARSADHPQMGQGGDTI